MLNHLVQRLQRGNHAFRVLLREVESRSFLQPIMPEFMPQDRDADELITYEPRLYSLQLCHALSGHSDAPAQQVLRCEPAYDPESRDRLASAKYWATLKPR